MLGEADFARDVVCKVSLHLSDKLLKSGSKVTSWLTLGRVRCLATGFRRGGACMQTVDWIPCTWCQKLSKCLLLAFVAVDGSRSGGWWRSLLVSNQGRVRSALHLLSTTHLTQIHAGLVRDYRDNRFSTRLSTGEW